MTAVLGWPVHAQEARTPKFVLPFAQEIELLFCADLQESQRQQKAGVLWDVFRHPLINVGLKVLQAGLSCCHNAFPLLSFNVA